MATNVTHEARDLAMRAAKAISSVCGDFSPETETEFADIILRETGLAEVTAERDKCREEIKRLEAFLRYYAYSGHVSDAKGAAEMWENDGYGGRARTALGISPDAKNVSHWDAEIKRLEASLGRMEEADEDEVDAAEYQRNLTRLVLLRKERAALAPSVASPAKDATEMILATERLPEVGEEVLIRWDGGGRAIACLTPRNKWRADAEPRDRPISDVTHWAPLPAKFVYYPPAAPTAPASPPAKGEAQGE